ncbi:MAG: STAS domain-containing protein [Cyanobacteriota bacterium]
MSILINYNKENLTIFVDEMFFNVNVARHFKKYFMEIMLEDINEIILDLSKVTILDSIAVGMLVHAQMICLQEEVRFLIINVHPEIMELIQQVKLDKILNVSQNLDNFDKH